jgi:1,5-anhydro-D-fructose reductase (1,5-anhydro-D-mannitol-forming)
VLNWLVIGVGDITRRRVLPAIAEEKRSRLAAIVTRDPAKARPYGVPAFGALSEALDKSATDAVYVATPVFLHASQTITSLQAAKHVLCEKPMAMNFSEAKSMVEASSQSRRMLGVAYYRRYYPKINRAKELLAQGAIGSPTLAWATYHSWLAPSLDARSWLADPAKAGGGPLFDVASHRIDVCNYLFGKPQHVAAQLSNSVHKLAVEDSATVMIEYENLVRAVVDVRWNSRVERDEFRIIGTDGEMQLTPLNGPGLVWPGGREELPVHPNVHLPCIHNFVDAVLDGSPLASSGETALATDWITEQAVIAARSQPDAH